MNRKRAARRARYFGNYILFCFVLTLLCVRVIAGDCIRHAQCGAFTYLPELNLAQYAPERTTELQNERLAKYRESLEYLETAERSGSWPVGRASRLINACLLLWLFNPAILHIARLLGVRIRKSARIFFAIGFVLALSIFIAGRVYVHGCFEERVFQRLYPAAYFTWRGALLYAAALIVLTLLIKRFKLHADANAEHSQ